jgi:uncharacterized membrane protein
MSFARVMRHLFALPWLVKRAFPQHAIERIEAAIGASEKRHRGEIRFAVEGALDFLPVARGASPRERALEVFSLLKVWDTEENTGVLVYVQLVDRDIEIVADRGIAKRIAQAQWDAICQRMESAFREGRFEEGAAAGVSEIGELLAAHFPASGQNADELPDRPTLL